MTATCPPPAPPPPGPSPHPPPGVPWPPSAVLDHEQAQTLSRLLEAAPSVHRRFQYFTWTQAQLQALLPHQLMVCGAYQRQRRSVVFDVFHSVVVSAATLEPLTDGDGPLLQWLNQAWVDGRGQPAALPLAQAPEPARPAARRLADELGLRELLVHGVARPQRPSEIESLFILGGPPAAEGSATRLARLDLVLPQLHRIWQRVMLTEQALMRPGEPAAPARGGTAPATGRDSPPAITPRERQILQWVRDGRSNQQVAEELGISPLTVKNHVQKILRKLGASNRAQAVARAMSQGLLAGDPGSGPRG